MLQSLTDFVLVATMMLISLLILWVIISIPVWVSAKILTLGRVKFTRAMLVTALGPVVYAVVFFTFTALLTAIVGESALPAFIGFIVAFIAWIGVFKKGFHTGWFRALGIAILAIIVFVVMGFILSLILQALVPGAPPITAPITLQQA